MKYKLIALDIDGTIRNTENPVSIRTIKIIKDLKIHIAGKYLPLLLIDTSP